MTPAKRQFSHLILFLFLDSATVMAASLQPSSVMSANISLAHQALTTLVSGPLSGHDLLLVNDDQTQRLLDMNQVVEAARASLTPVLLATQYSLLHTPRPAHHTQGSLLTALLLFHQDPTDFLLLLADNTNWNPSYLVLFCLNPHLNTTTVLSQPVVQRSHFILLLHPTPGRQHFQAYTSLPLQVSARGHSLTKAPLGVWSSDKFLSRQSLFPPRFQTFGGQVLEVTVLCYDEPFLYFGENGGCIGVNVDALHIIGAKLLFEFSMSSPDTIAWGYKENGTWKGLLGQLMYEGKDLMINVLQPNPERASDFDYIYPYWDTNFAFLLLSPAPLPQWMNILHPFSLLMWILVFATTVTVASLLALLLHHILGLEDSIGIVLKVASCLVGQGVGGLGDVRELWVRVWLVCWWLTVDILSSVYTGTLVAILTVPTFPPVLHTVEELASTNLIPSMADYGSFVPDALKTSKNPTLATLGDKLFLDSDMTPWDPYKALIGRVLNGTHTLLVVGDYLRFTQSKKKITRSTYLMDEKLYQNYMTWFLPRHTPYTSTFSHHIIRLLETGVLAKLYQNHVGTLIGEDRQVHGDGVLNLGHLQGAFILLGLGLVAATLTLLLEHLTNPRPSLSPPTTLNHPATN